MLPSARAQSPEQQGAGAGVTLNFLSLPGDAADSLSQTVSATADQGRRQL